MTSSLPEWIILEQKRSEPKSANDRLLKALVIAWEALERVRTQPHDNIRGYAYEALRRIRELGASQAPRETK